MEINGEDERGVEWTGEVDLDVDDNGHISGTISWESSTGRSGNERVRGTLGGDGTLEMHGVSVDSTDIVCCEYEGTWIDDYFDVDWVGHCPAGHASTEDEESDESDEEANSKDW